MGLVTLNLPQKTSSKANDGDTLKRRLLGAAVLIALAVIFLPLLLDGSGSESRFRRVEQLRTQPPRIIGPDGKLESTSAPVLDKTTKPRAKVVKAATPTAAPTATPKVEKVPETVVPPAPVVTAAPPAEKTANTERVTKSSNEVQELVAWIVQAGSFSDELNALMLRDELRAQGFPSFVTLADSAGQSLYRVKVGPMTDRAKADSSKLQLEKIIGHETIVRQYP